jgi:apolipoprotein N-acyltransferase
MRSWMLQLAGAALTAVLLAALFPPFGLAFFAPVALAPLLYAVAHQPFAGRRFLWGWLSGFLYWVIVCHWIGDVLLAYGGLNGPLSVLAVVLFAAAKGLHCAVFAWLAGHIIKRPWAIPAVAALWTGIERTHSTFGFAWLALGNAGISMALPLRIAPVLGVYGLSFIFAALACGITLVALRRNRRELLWLACLPGLLVLPSVEPAKAPAERAVSMQTNIKGDAPWVASTANELALATLVEASDPAKRKPALLLWPEAPAPFYYYDDARFRQQVTELARAAGAPFLFGGVTQTAERAPLNSAILLGADGRLSGRYDKVHLVPFGEFIPPGFGWIQKISSEAGDFVPGPGAKVLRTDEHTLGAFICYESAFPHYVRQFANGGAEVLVNVTNDGYFGRGAAPRTQHLELARMRAVENGRWVLRTSNDGVTASIDPAGRVLDRIPDYTRRAASLRFAWLRGKTLYTRFGDWFAWLCLFAGLAAVVAAQVPVYRRP